MSRENGVVTCLKTCRRIYRQSFGVDARLAQRNANGESLPVQTGVEDRGYLGEDYFDVHGDKVQHCLVRLV